MGLGTLYSLCCRMDKYNMEPIHGIPEFERCGKYYDNTPPSAVAGADTLGCIKIESYSVTGDEKMWHYCIKFSPMLFLLTSDDTTSSNLYFKNRRMLAVIGGL